MGRLRVRLRVEARRVDRATAVARIALPVDADGRVARGRRRRVPGAEPDDIERARGSCNRERDPPCPHAPGHD
jgi:hypothetical protein